MRKELGKGWTYERLRMLWIRPRPIPERVLRAWRTYAPEQVIHIIINHRAEIYRRRRETEWVTIPEFAYPLPKLKEIEQKPEVFAVAIDTDGLIQTRVKHGRDRLTKIDRWTYRYEYVRPKIWFWSETLQLAVKVANMILAPIRPARPRPQRRPSISYVTETEHASAIIATYLAEPYLIKWKERANQIIKIYKNTPSIRTR